LSGIKLIHIELGEVYPFQIKSSWVNVGTS